MVLNPGQIMEIKFLKGKVCHRLTFILGCTIALGLPQRGTAQLFTDKNYVKISPADKEAVILCCN
jgi:alpha-L-fucosidase